MAGLPKEITLIGRRLIAVLALSGVALAAFAQSTFRPNPPLVSGSLTGGDLFQFYCATCHGRDGKGSGPVAAALKIPPPDLTLLARRSGGTFPQQQVAAFVENAGQPSIPSHGGTDMPVWGPVFRGLDSSESVAKIRITNLVDYLRTIQVK